MLLEDKKEVVSLAHLSSVTAGTVCSHSVSVCQWVVGAQCLAVWSEDGRVYPAKVVSVDGERCRVRFHGYNNEEEVEVSSLRSPDTALQTQRQNSQVISTLTHTRVGEGTDTSTISSRLHPPIACWLVGAAIFVYF